MLFSSLFSFALASLALLPSINAVAVEKRQLADVITHCQNPNQVALTFDDGPYIYMNDISDTLAAAGAKGTFFVNGDNFGCIYSDENIERLRYAHNNGHQISSHTWAHKDLATLSLDEVHDEMWRLEEALIRILGVYPAFMRPPHGSFNDNVRAASAARSQTIVNWDLDSGDTVGVSTTTSNALYDQAIANGASSILGLHHETKENTVKEVIPYVISALQTAGYELVTVAECLNMEPYQWTTAPGTKDSSWTC